MLGAAITGFLFLIRIPVVRISVPRSTSPKDASYMATMIPKGLGAAVLASLPAQQGVEGGEIIQSVVFSIILCSTVGTTILTFLVDRTFVARIYAWIFCILGLRKVEETEPELEPDLEAKYLAIAPESEVLAPVKEKPKRLRTKKIKELGP